MRSKTPKLVMFEMECGYAEASPWLLGSWVAGGLPAWVTLEPVFTDGPHRMSTGLPGGEKREQYFRQREQHEQNNGGRKSTRPLGYSVTGESGPGLRGKGGGWRERPREGPQRSAGEPTRSPVGGRKATGCLRQVNTQPELFQEGHPRRTSMIWTDGESRGACGVLSGHKSRGLVLFLLQLCSSQPGTSRAAAIVVSGCRVLPEHSRTFYEKQIPRTHLLRI